MNINRLVIFCSLSFLFPVDDLDINYLSDDLFSNSIYFDLESHNKTGYLFENKNPKDLADLISMIMKKDYNSLKSIGFEGRKNVLKRFDVDKMCQTTFTEYKKLIELS